MKHIGGNDRHERGPGQGIHELLCAHVLGELDGAERARLERELEASPELRAERARIAATIECVRGALGGPESLSPKMLESLELRAMPPHPRLARHWIRAAAVLGFCALGLFALREGGSRAPALDGEERLARVQAEAHPPARSATGPAELTSAEARKATDELMRGLGYAVDVVEEQARPSDAPAETKVEVLQTIVDQLGIGGGGGGRGSLQLGPGSAEGSASSGPSTPGWIGNEQLVLPEMLLAFGESGRESTATLSARSVSIPEPTTVELGVRARLDAARELPAPPSTATTVGPAAGVTARFEKKDDKYGLPAEGADRFHTSNMRSMDVSDELRAGLERDRPHSADHLLADCRRRPGERPSAMFFRFWGDNPFVLSQLESRSTFGADVDTASYALARRMLSAGHLPEKAQIRTEEFVNYFAPDLPAPLEDTFAVHSDLAPSRFGGTADGLRPAERWMLRVVLRGKEVARSERQPLALTFVIDVSGSMRQENRLELVKHSLRLLLAELDARDSIALVAFSNEARLVLPMTSVAQRGIVESAIHGLSTGGGTNAEAGLKLGYEVALASLSRAAHSRVVLLSDGVANIGQTDQDRVNADVRRHREAGIFLNTVGVGLGNHNDVFLEQLANKGDGLCNYVDDAQEARRALVDNFTGAFQPIARDVKVQLEFDPEKVFRWRLLGYENRAIANQDFRNDAVDAGEVGAGHQVTALYELELLAPPSAETGSLCTVRLRWKEPTGAGRDPLEDAATEREHQVLGARATSWEGSSAGYKRAVLVAQLAEILRRSTHARGDSIDELLAEATVLDRHLDDADFREFVAMVERTRSLAHAWRHAHDPLETCLDALRRNEHLRAELGELRWEKAPALLEDLERQNRELEARIRELLRDQYREGRR